MCEFHAQMGDNMLNLLAFDYGASSGRAMLGQYDSNKIQLKEVHRFLNQPVHLNGSFYWDILRLFHEMKQGLLKTVQNYEGDIAAIGTDTWGVDFGLLDARGNLLGNPYHYRDSRTENMIDEAAKVVERRNIYQETGIAFQPFNTLYQMLAMKKYNPEILDNAKTMLFIPDLFNYFLTGEKHAEYTIASTSQMLNANEKNWNIKLLEKFGLPVNLLPNIVAAGTINGRLSVNISNELGVGSIPVVSVASHDTASAVVSVPASKGNYAYLSSGTWSLLGVEVKQPVINDDTYNFNYTNEGGFNNTIRLLKNIMGLWIYQECIRDWTKNGQSVTFDEVEGGCLNTQPFQSLINPDDNSFYSPGNMPAKIADYCANTNQPVPQSKGEFARCIFESLALKYRMALEELERIIGYRLPVLHIVGGGCKNEVLSQFTANAIGRPVITGPDEATAFGNIISQLYALGEIKNLGEGREIVRNSTPTREYLPENVDQWDDAYNKFKKLTCDCM